MTYLELDKWRLLLYLDGEVLRCWCWSLIATRLRSIFFVAWTQALWISDPENPLVMSAIEVISTFFHVLLSDTREAKLLQRINFLFSSCGKPTFIILWKRLRSPGSIVHGKLVEARKRNGCLYLTTPSNCTKNSALHLKN